MSDTKKITNLDLVLTAQPAALAALKAPGTFEAHEIKMNAFKSAGHDRLDYDLWSSLFEDELAAYSGASRVATPSQTAADKLTAETNPTPNKNL